MTECNIEDAVAPASFAPGEWLYALTASIDPGVPLQRDEALQLLATIREALASRREELRGEGSGSTWSAFLAIGRGE